MGCVRSKEQKKKQENEQQIHNDYNQFMKGLSHAMGLKNTFQEWDTVRDSPFL